MISLYDYQTYSALPPEMKTPEGKASCYAFDRQKKKFLERLERVYIYADIEKVSDDKLDFLAVENRVLFYNTGLAPDVKRTLIKNSIYWYMKLGTSQAMTEMIDIVFGNENTSVEEWYTYAGEPFHFRVAVGTEVTQTSISEFLRYLKTIKNARSRFDYLVFQNGITLKIKTRADYLNFLYTFCGEFECGTYPNTEVGFRGAEVQISLEGASDTASTVYQEAGTAPDISVGAAFVQNTVDLQGGTNENSVLYQADGERESGTAPDISVGAIYAESQIDLQGDSADQDIFYQADGEAHSGTAPDISVGFSGGESGIALEGDSGAGYAAYQDTGTAPDISVGFSSGAGEIALEGASDTASAAYQESGTAPDVSIGAQFNEVSVGLEGSSQESEAFYSSDGEAESGSFPDPEVGFAGAESGVFASPEGADFNLYYNTDADKTAESE